LVQLVLTLFRNILAVQEIPLHLKSGGLATQFLSLRDRFLELLFRENVMDIILVISQYVGGSNTYLRQDNLLLLEIFHYILMGQDPELIIRAHSKGSKVSPHGDQCLFLPSWQGASYLFRLFFSDCTLITLFARSFGMCDFIFFLVNYEL